MTVNPMHSNACVYEREVQLEHINISDYFREQRKALQEYYGEGDRDYYPTEKIAKSLGLSTEMLQKKIYGRKKLTREWLIAIGAAHGLDSFEIDDLLLELKMPKLDSDVPREDFIIDFLTKEKDAPVGRMISLKAFDDALVDCGHSPLNTGRKEAQSRKKSTLLPFNSKERKRHEKSAMPYNIERTIIRTYMDEGDQYESLSTAYDFRYHCVAIAVLSKEGRVIAELEAMPDETFLITVPNQPLPQIVRTLSETGEYKDYFIDLLAMARREKHRVEMQLFDTKNYHSRYAANLRNDRIHVFLEEFNYRLPERNEYYFMEWIDGHLRLTISTQSMFMREYLNRNDYLRKYGDAEKRPRITYDSLEEIDAVLNSDKLNGYTHELLKMRKAAFNRMGNNILQIIEDIKMRKVFIRNYDAIYGDDPGEVCRYFNLMDEFACTTNEDNRISVGLENATITSPEGHSISLTFEDLKRAFELGYIDRRQICRAIMMFGSVEAVF